MIQNLIDEIYKYLFLRNIPIALFAIILAILLIVGITKKIIEFKKHVVCIIISVILIISCISYIIYDFSIFKSDNFVIYQGEFEYKYISGQADIIVLMDNGNQLYSEGLQNTLDNGVYQGILIYTEKSKWVVSYEIMTHKSGDASRPLKKSVNYDKFEGKRT